MSAKVIALKRRKRHAVASVPLFSNADLPIPGESVVQQVRESIAEALRASLDVEAAKRSHRVVFALQHQEPRANCAALYLTEALALVPGDEHAKTFDSLLDAKTFLDHNRAKLGALHYWYAVALIRQEVQQ